MKYAATISRANSFLEKYGISEPKDIDLEAIAFDRGLLIQEKDLKGCEGRLLVKKKNGLIVVDNKIKEPGKKRFVIAHEIGHFESHQRNDEIKICDESSFINWHKNNDRENEANVFAAEILMPRELFNSFSDNISFEKNIIINIADYFNCSLSASALRYAEIGSIPIAVIFSQNKQVKWYRCNKNLPFQFIDIRTMVNSNSYVYDFFKGGKIPELPEKISCDAWFGNDHNYEKEIELLEQNIPLPNYNAILSFVWMA